MTTINEQAKVLSQLSQIATIFKSSGGVIRPHFLLTGPSGSGKSYIAQALAEQHELGFLEINAAQLTKEGTSGNSLSKALAGLNSKAGVPTIVFVDEFDKLFISGNNNSELAHETTNGVQNEFLKVLESKTTSVFGDYGKYTPVSLQNVLFVFAGAFNGEENMSIDKLRDMGLKVEFLGRVGLVYNLPKLSLESMHTALKNSPTLANYLKLFEDVNADEVVETLMPHITKAHDKNTLGIRLINTLLHQYFINGGVLPEAEVKSSAFQHSLKLKAA